MLSLRLSACALASGLALAGTAAAATPAQELAATLKPSMQSYYSTHDPGTKITRVSCTVNAAETKGTCHADFTVGSLDGVFLLHETIDRATGNISTQTVSATCHVAATGKRASCF